MIRISSKIFFVAWMCNCLLQKISVLEGVADSFFQIFQRMMESKMIDKDRKQKCMLDNVSHETSSNEEMEMELI